MREDVERVLGEELHQIVNKNMIIGHISKMKALSFLPRKKLEWLAEAFSKHKFQNKNEIVFST